MIEPFPKHGCGNLSKNITVGLTPRAGYINMIWLAIDALHRSILRTCFRAKLSEASNGNERLRPPTKADRVLSYRTNQTPEPCT
jgi:hypothetical protein